MFGPLLPIRTYKDFEETIGYINRQPRPLAAYYFGEDKGEEDSFTQRTTSGGVCINDVIMHVMQEELPFGGVGTSRAPASLPARRGDADPTRRGARPLADVRG